MIVFEQRACTVLFNLLKAHQVDGPFLLPSNVCPVVPLTFLKAGRRFEFVDIAPDTLCMDAQRVRDRWKASGLATPAGVVFVRTYGALFDSESLFADIKELSPEALIVDDRCLCEPNFDAELVRHVDAVLYSTGYAKFVDIGFGGVGVLREGVPYEHTVLDFDSKDLINATESYKRALEERKIFQYVDVNWLETALPGCSWLDYRERVECELIRAKEIKKKIGLVYASGLPRAIQFPSEFQNWRFNIHVCDKLAVLDAIAASGLFASGHYDSLAGVLGVGDGAYSQFVHRHVINLFNDRYFSVQRAEALVDLLIGLNMLRSGELFE